MSEVSTAPVAIDPFPATLETSCGPATELPIDLFLHRALPPLKDGVDIKQIADRLVRTEKRSSSCEPITREDRWRGFDQDPAKMECCPEVVFQSFPDAVLSIIKASCSNNFTPCAPISFKNDPHYRKEYENRKAGELPDAYLLSSEPPAWSNIMASGEYKRTDREEDREAVSRNL